MNVAVGRGALVALLAIATACSEVTPPTAPTPTADSTTSTPAPGSGPAPRGFPDVSEPARIFVAVYGPSRYVLYDDGRFALQYSSANQSFFEYRGVYKEANALITFEWEGWSTAGPWGATGSLSGDSLTVRYNLIMQLSDFEDGVYIRTP